MTRKDLIKKAQSAIGVTADGDWGPITTAKAEEFELVDVAVKRKAAEAAKPAPAAGEYFGAAWVASFLSFLGLSETNASLNAALVPEWAKEGLPGYKTLAGNTHAWCSVLVNASFRKVGIKPTNSAGAASWSKWGKKCPFWFGSVLDIKHRSGGRHVAFFLYWIDESKKLAAVYGGNQGNKLSIVSQTINSTGDVCVSGPRWPADQPDGQLVSKAEVLAKYPLLKVGGSAGSTR